MAAMCCDRETEGARQRRVRKVIQIVMLPILPFWDIDRRLRARIVWVESIILALAAVYLCQYHWQLSEPVAARWVYGCVMVFGWIFFSIPEIVYEWRSPHRDKDITAMIGVFLVPILWFFGYAMLAI